MGSSFANTASDRHRTLLEDVHPKQAKAYLKPVETVNFAEEIGGAVERAVALAGLSKKEAAAVVGVEAAQLSRWIAGTERPQFDRLFAVAELREPMVVALAKVAGAEIETQIKFPVRAA